MGLIDKWLPKGALIDGNWITSDDVFPVIDPATGTTVASVPNLGAAEATMAVDAASRALPAWSAKTAKERAQILRRWYDLIVAHTESLALLMTTEQGKPLAEARSEVSYGASFIEWFAEEGKRAYGRTIPSTIASKRYLTIKQPVGVIAAIAPWNFPIAMITRKIAPALAAGCTAVIKPSEETPLCALAVGKLALEAGIPAGVLNIVTALDAKAVGQAWCSDARVRKLSFTGSTAVGKLLYRQSADTLKKLTLELGGNAPIVVFDDADLEQAVEGTIASKFRNAGQTCVSANRILVQSGIYERFAAALVAAVGNLTVGPGRDERNKIGPVINRQAIVKIDNLVERAKSSGAKALIGGGRDPAGSLFYAPTVLSEVSPSVDIVQQEVFGPVASLIRFDSEAEAVRIANDTPFGLAAYIFTQNVGRAWRVAEKLEAGMVGINEGIISNEAAPFGGVKESGLGREGAAEGLDEYLEVKYICLGGVHDLARD